jgi:hypothetical protein
MEKERTDIEIRELCICRPLKFAGRAGEWSELVQEAERAMAMSMASYLGNSRDKFQLNMRNP